MTDTPPKQPRARVHRSSGKRLARTPELITHLMPGQIIVIGSNKFGLHAGGAARYAHQHFGLRWGVGEGLSGQVYALPTMEGLEELRVAVGKFIAYAELSHDLTFLLTKVGCGIAGFSEEEVSPLFADAPVNVLRPEGWPPFSGKPLASLADLMSPASKDTPAPAGDFSKEDREHIRQLMDTGEEESEPDA